MSRASCLTVEDQNSNWYAIQHLDLLENEIMIDIIPTTHASIMFACTHSVRMALILVFLASGVSAQDINTSPTSGSTPLGLAPGAPAGSFALSGFDNINPYNGNLNFSLPLLQVGGRGGASTTIRLTMESHWTVRDRITVNGCSPSNVCNYAHNYYAEPNWWEGIPSSYGSPGALIARKGGIDSRSRCAFGPSPDAYEYTLTRLTFVSADGTEHELRDQLTGGAPYDNSNNSCNGNVFHFSRGTVFVSADGTAMTFVSDANISDAFTPGEGGLSYPQACCISVMALPIV
jgi:hypothetical protein